jgi:heptosyltransferase-3
VLRVLIIRPGALGDTLMLLPALNALAGKVAVAFVGRQPGLDFIRPHVDRAMDLEASGWHRLFMDTPDGKGLPVSDMEIVAAFFSDKDGMIRRNLERFLPCAAVHVFRSFPLKGEDIHVAVHLARCLESAGLPVDPVRSIQAVRNGSLSNGTRSSAGRNAIVLHPGSGSLEKNHPPGFWVELAIRLSREAVFKGFKRVLLLGPAEESLRAYFVENLQSGDTEIAPSWDSDLLLQTLDSAALYLGHDSGITHLSAMRCVPTVALFRKGNAVQWAPLGPFVRVIKNQGPAPQLLEVILEAARNVVSMHHPS